MSKKIFMNLNNSLSNINIIKNQNQNQNQVIRSNINKKKNYNSFRSNMISRLNGAVKCGSCGG
jgi:hypothetical protein